MIGIFPNSDRSMRTGRDDFRRGIKENVQESFTRGSINGTFDRSVINILLVDDDEDDYVVTRDLLSEINAWRPRLTWASNFRQALEAMNDGCFDVYLVDYHLGGENGLELIRQMIREGCPAPIILLTGQGDLELDLKAMKFGAADYLDKSEIGPALLERSIRNAIERYRLQYQLKAGEERLESIINANADGLVIMNRHRKILFANPAAQKILNCDGKYMGRYFPQEVHLTDTPEEMAVVCRDGTTVNVEMRMVEIDWQGDNAYLASIRDVTVRRKAEEQIRLLTRQLLKTQENERRKLARDLHDSIAQQMSALKIGIDTLFDSCVNISTGLKQKAHQCSRILSELVAEIRNLAYDLRPASLECLGLSQSLFRYCREFSDMTGIQVNFMSAGMEEAALNPEVEINLYRMIQESLNNIKKHAEANQVTVRLTVSYPKIILRVEDNGKGFEVEKRLLSALDEKRMGLWSMNERVKLFNGRMQVYSRLNIGTRIVIELSPEQYMES